MSDLAAFIAIVCCIASIFGAIVGAEWVIYFSALGFGIACVLNWIETK